MELIIIKISYVVQGGIGLLLLIILYKLIRAFINSRESVIRRILKHGSKAHAKVLSCEKILVEATGAEQMKLLLQVEPERGRSFVTEVLTSIEEYRSQNIQSGSKVQVMYNPIDRRQVVLTGTV